MSREMKFRITYQHEETGRFTSRDIMLGELIPQMDGWHVIGKDQYTGLKDKNGKEIYEGDIVSTEIKWFDDEENLPGHMRPEKKNREVKNMGINIFYRGDWSIEPDDVEIIGNIYENADLLK